MWRVAGLDETLENVRWRRFASGLHQALGLVVADGKAYVLGRDQITRLHDFERRRRGRLLRVLLQRLSDSTGGHDFICGLERDSAGRFYTASSKSGCCGSRPTAARSKSSRPAFAIPTASAWPPTARSPSPIPKANGCRSMICEVRPGGHYGYPGPKNGRPGPPSRLPAARPRQFERRPGDRPRRPIRPARRAS